METKREKSIRIAEARTNVVIEALSRLGAIVDKDYYELTEDDLMKIIAAIDKEVDDLKSHFIKGKRKKFQLEDKRI